jgi:hypothetical protein
MTTTISGSSGIVFPDLTTMQTGQQAVKAWVNFNGTGTVAIRAGYNVSSITDNGVGDYTVNFTTAMPDANYAMGGSSKIDSNNGDSNSWIVGVRRNSGNPSTSQCRIGVFFHNNNSAQDGEIINASFFR